MINKFLNKNKIILLILLIIFLKELLLVMIIPLWQNNDEIKHFAYTYYIVEELKLPSANGGYLDITPTKEIAAADELLENNKIYFGVIKRNQIIHQNFNTSLENINLRKQLLNLDRKNTSIPYLNAATVYPPLYYLLEAIPYKIFQDFSINTRAYAMRIFGLLFMLVTILFSFKISKFFFKNKNTPYIIAMLIGFLPRYSFTAAGINNDALLIMISTIIIYYLIKFLDQKLNYKTNIFLGILFGIGLLSKPQFYIFIVILLIFYTYKLFRYKKIKPIIISLITAILICLIISSGWFIFNNLTENNLPNEHLSVLLGVGSNSNDNLSILDITHYVILRYLFLISSFFGMLGCCNEISLSPLIQGLFLISMFVGIFGYLLFLLNTKYIFKKFKFILILLIPFLLEMGYLTIYIRQLLVSGTNSLTILVDGRYFFAVISCLTILFIMGILHITPKKIHESLLIIILFVIIYINFYTLIFNIIPRYYL